MMGTGYNSKRRMAEGRDDWFYRRCVGWTLKFALLPHRCYISNRLIWLKYGYQGMSVLTGPGEPIIEFRWHDSGEHLLWLLKQ